MKASGKALEVAMTAVIDAVVGNLIFYPFPVTLHPLNYNHLFPYIYPAQRAYNESQKGHSGWQKATGPLQELQEWPHSSPISGYIRSNKKDKVTGKHFNLIGHSLSDMKATN